MKNKLFFLGAILLIVTSCKTNKTEKEEKTQGIVLENMDTKVKPSEDFFRYVNGKWLDNNKIPESRTSWGSFAELRKKTDDDVLAILENAIKDKELDPNSDQKKAVNYYESIMDTITRNKQGIEPLKPFLNKINNIKNLSDLQKLTIETAPYGRLGFYGFYVSSDMKNSKVNTGYLSPARLGLPRDYYVDKDVNTEEKRQKYVAHIAKMLQFFGDPKKIAEENAQKIFNYEYQLALPRLTKEERRDARKRYNPMTIAQISKTTPLINWKNYFKGLGVGSLEKVIVTEPNYFKELNKILKKSSIKDIKQYLRWTFINRNAGLLNSELEKANWEFFSKELKGAKEQRPRKERALASVNSAIGEALGKLYVDEKFPPEAKEKAEIMIDNIMDAFAERIKKVEWMTKETKEKALEKLEKMSVKIAYPDKWKDYSALEIKAVTDGGSYYENVNQIRKWSFNRNINKLGKPVDKTEWHMSPQTVNAYFNAVNNEIVFPAGILQPPFYNHQADEAVNYGGIGAVIGHEISHCFDDSGARFDADGNLNNWWTEEDAKKFKKLGKKLVNQYNKLEALKGVFVNGEFTLGENIGDLGGVNVAYDGLQMFFNKNKKPKAIDGFTAEQRFFISWATIWRIKMRDEALQNRIKTDPHAPGKFRAYVPLQNVDAFYSAFAIKKGDKMYIKPEDRVKIW